MAACPLRTGRQDLYGLSNEGAVVHAHPACLEHECAWWVITGESHQGVMVGHCVAHEIAKNLKFEEPA